MTLSERDKSEIKREVARCLKSEPEVRRVVIFGSFCASPDPNDIDVAVFQDSEESYLPLALRYRRLLRPVADRIPLDVLPLRAAAHGGWFVNQEVARGEVIYERQS